MCEPCYKSVVMSVCSTYAEAPQSPAVPRSTEGLVSTSSSREGKVSQAAVRTMQSPGKRTAQERSEGAMHST